MEENRFALAGWLAIVQAVLFPVTIVLGIIEAGFAAFTLDIRRPYIGPSDLLMIPFTIIAVYTLLKFRSLLHERYEYHDLDLLVTLSIAWIIVFQVAGFALGVLAMVYWPIDQLLLTVTYVIFLTGAMVTIGIVDILIAVKLLRVKERFSEYIRGFAYVTMAAGICEVTVLFSVLAFVLVPVSAIVLALVFFRDRQEVEFV